jgi:hypothetical protein
MCGKVINNSVCDTEEEAVDKYRELKRGHSIEVLNTYKEVLSDKAYSEINKLIDNI